MKKEIKLVAAGVIILGLALILKWWVNRPETKPTTENTAAEEEELISRVDSPDELTGMEVFENEEIILILNSDGIFYWNEGYNEDETTQAKSLSGSWSEDEAQTVVILGFNDSDEIRELQRLENGDLQFENQVLTKIQDLAERVVNLSDEVAE